MNELTRKKLMRKKKTWNKSEIEDIQICRINSSSSQAYFFTTSRHYCFSYHLNRPFPLPILRDPIGNRNKDGGNKGCA